MTQCSYIQHQIVSTHELNVSSYHLMSITDPPGVVRGWQLTHATHSNSQHMILTHEAITGSRRNSDVSKSCKSFSSTIVPKRVPAPPRLRFPRKIICSVERGVGSFWSARDEREERVQVGAHHTRFCNFGDCLGVRFPVRVTPIIFEL
jgi:hypothetical protein